MNTGIIYFDLHSDASSEQEAFSGAPHLRESALSSQIVRFVKFCSFRWLWLKLLKLGSDQFALTWSCL